MGGSVDLTQMLIDCLDHVAQLNQRRMAMLGDWTHVNKNSGEMHKIHEEIVCMEQLIWDIKNVRAEFEQMQRKARA